MIVGAYSVAFHGAPRYTGDLVIFVQPDAVHVARMLDALRESGFSTAGNVAPDYLVDEHKILQLGVPPRQVHLMTQISGLDWDSAWASRIRGQYGDVAVFYLGREALIANKKAAGRPKDLADIAALEGRDR